MFKIIILLFISQNLSAQKLQKVGGVFIVHKILALKAGEFKIVFKAKEKAVESISSIELLTDHIHPGITEGQEMKISAEIESIKNHVASATQILVFVPAKHGANPVWLVAHGKNFTAPESDFLKMHAPSNDFIIL